MEVVELKGVFGLHLVKCSYLNQLLNFSHSLFGLVD